MARWGRTLWSVGVGAVLAGSAVAAAPQGAGRKGDTISTQRPSNNELKSQFLARVQAYSDLNEEMARLAEVRAGTQGVRDLAKRIFEDHHAWNGRMANYVLSRHVNLPDATLSGEEKDRFKQAMSQVQKLETLNGAAFDRAFITTAQQLPMMTARELMSARQEFTTDPDLLSVVDPLIQATDQHRKDAEALAQQGGAAAARRPQDNR